MGHAIFEQRSGVLGVAVASPCGVVTADQLIGLGKLAEKITVHGMKLTTRQTVVFLIDKENLDQFKEAIEDLGLKIGVFGSVVRNVKGCAGSASLCQRSIGDAFGLGVSLQERFMNQPAPKDFKISTAGCVRACTDPYCADFGVIAVGPDCYDVYIGGRGGSRVPRHAERILERVATEKVAEVLEYVLERYRELGKPDERLCRTIDRVGVDKFVPPPAVYQTEAAATLADDFADFLAQK